MDNVTLNDSRNLAEILQEIDQLLAQNAPLVFASLKPGASGHDLEALAKNLGIDELPEDLVTWFCWHNGQAADAHRPLSPMDTYHRPLSIRESIACITELRTTGDYIEGAVPIIRGGGESPSGYLCTGLKAGTLVKFGHDMQFVGCTSLKQLALAILAKFRDATTRPEPGRYWVHGVSALLVEGNRYHHALVGGLWRFSSAHCAQVIFTKYWGIYSEKYLQQTLTNLLSEKDDSEESGNPEDSEDTETSNNRLAWDLGRAASLAGLGYVRGWLELDATWAIQYYCATRIQQAFGSWREYIEAYRSQYALGAPGNPGGGIDSDWLGADLGMLDQNIESLFADPTSPVHLPWNTLLDPTPTPALAEYHLRFGPDQVGELRNLLSSRITPRHIVVHLAEGDYRVTSKVYQSVTIQGAGLNRTRLLGCDLNAPGLILLCGGYALNDLSLELAPELDSKGSAFMTLSVLNANRCRFRGTGHGARICERSYAGLNHCEVVAETRRGLIVSGACDLIATRVTGPEGGIDVDQDACLFIEDSEVQSAACSLLVEAGFVSAYRASFISDQEEAAKLSDAARVFADNCRFFSQQNDAIATLLEDDDDEDEGDEERGDENQDEIQPTSIYSRLVLSNCSLSGNEHAIYGSGVDAELFACDLQSPVLMEEGSLWAKETRFHESVTARLESRLYLLDSTITASASPCLIVEDGASLYASGCTLQTGVQLDAGAMRLEHCKLQSAELSCAVIDGGGILSLNQCELQQTTTTQMIQLVDGKLYAVDSRFDLKQVGLVTNPDTAAHLWRCRFDSDAADSLQLMNSGRVYLLDSSFYSGGWALHGKAGSISFVDDCGASCPNNPLSKEENAAIIEDQVVRWSGLQRINEHQLQINFSQLASEARDLANALEAWPSDGPQYFLQSALHLAAKDQSITITGEGESWQLQGQEPLSPVLENFLARAASDPLCFQALLWMIPPDTNTASLEISWSGLHQHMLRGDSDEDEI